MNIRVLLPLISVMALVACGGVPIAEITATLASTTPCCRTYAELPYGRLEEGSRTKFQVNTASPAFASPVGVAYGAAFKLPNGAKSISIQALSSDYLPKASYPDPVLVFLDSTKQPSHLLMTLNLQRGRHAFIPGVYEYFYGARVTVPQGAEYVVVFVHPKSTRVQRAVSDNGTVWPVRAAPVGTLAVIPG
jgi:hypothetical protein